MIMLWPSLVSAAKVRSPIVRYEHPRARVREGCTSLGFFFR